MSEYRPSCGGGSCALCRGALGLDALRQGTEWYCSVGCAQGLGPPPPRAPVADERLYHRPLRHYAKRRPKELRAGSC